MSSGHIALALGVGVFAVCLLSSAFRRRPSLRGVASAVAAPIARAVATAPAAPVNPLRAYHDWLEGARREAAFDQLARDAIADGQPAEVERIRASIFPKAGPPPAP